MTACDRDHEDAQDCRALLERALIEEYLGYPLSALNASPDATTPSLMSKACLFAALRLEEISARSRWLQNLHGMVSSSGDHLMGWS